MPAHIHLVPSTAEASLEAWISRVEIDSRRQPTVPIALVAGHVLPAAVMALPHARDGRRARTIDVPSNDAAHAAHAHINAHPHARVCASASARAESRHRGALTCPRLATAIVSMG